MLIIISNKIKFMYLTQNFSVCVTVCESFVGETNRQGTFTGSLQITWKSSKNAQTACISVISIPFGGENKKVFAAFFYQNILDVLGWFLKLFSIIFSRFLGRYFPICNIKIHITFGNKKPESYLNFEISVCIYIKQNHRFPFICSETEPVWSLLF